MTNSMELEADIARANVSKKVIYESLGTSAQALWNKIHNVSEFKASEIKIMQRILGQSDERRDFVFFAEKRD